jgi:radical SAM superfamily enzyme YgiQ (UPF0313 family)
MTDTGPYSSWYDRTYHLLTGNGLWLNGNEINSLDPSEYGRRTFRVLIARLSTYYDTAESFSHKVLYQIARKQRGVFPDFAFLPPLHDGPLMASHNIPWLLGTATKRGPLDFDMVAFSNSTVQELVNVVVMLHNSGIPPGKKARMADQKCPLIILGGSNAVNTGIFFTSDPPVDGIFVGDSAESIGRIFELCAAARSKALSKQETLSRLETVPGFVRPDKPRRTRSARAAVPDLNPLLETAPVSNLSDRLGTGNLQISDGCPCFCGFCSESFGKKPYREIPAADAAAQACRMKAGMGLDKVELYSFNFNMHSELEPILENLLRMFPAVGLKSQRFDMLAQEPTMVPGLLAVGKSSLTCGLEGISARLRRYLHKSVSEDDVKRSLSKIVAAPVRELKIFLLITGKEEEKDLAEFEALLRFIKECSVESGAKPRIILSATPLVRFPWTPLEFEDAPTPEVLRPISLRFKRLVERHGFEFRMSSDLNEYHLSQILARASHPRMYEALVDAARRTGYAYYRTVPSAFVNAFTESCEALGISSGGMLAGTQRDDGSKPWFNVDTGVERKFLIKQHKNAVEFVDKGYCLGSADGDGACLACGACEAGERKAITHLRKREPLRPERLKELSRRWREECAVSFRVRAADSLRGLPRQSLGIALAKALMTAEPALVGSYAGYCGSFWGKGDQPCWVTGDDIVTLRFQRQGMELIEKLVAAESPLSKVNVVLQPWGRLINIVGNTPAQWVIAIRSPYDFDPKAYFTDNGLTYVLKKIAEGKYSFDFSAKALRKKIMRSLEYENTEGPGAKLRLAVLEKFDYEGFVKTSFAFGDEREWVRVRVEAEADRT